MVEFATNFEALAYVVGAICLSIAFLSGGEE